MLGNRLCSESLRSRPHVNTTINKKRGNAFGTTHKEPFRSRASSQSIGHIMREVNQLFLLSHHERILRRCSRLALRTEPR